MVELLGTEQVRYTPYGVAQVRLREDINGSGTVDGGDLGLMLGNWGKNYGDPSYDPDIDINRDGKTDGADLGLISGAWQTYDNTPGRISTVGNTVGYAGYQYDEAVDLSLARFRWYDANRARWLNRDPIGYAGGSNSLYQYVGSRPTGYSDPLGLSIWKWIEPLLDFPTDEEKKSCSCDTYKEQKERCDTLKKNIDEAQDEIDDLGDELDQIREEMINLAGQEVWARRADIVNTVAGGAVSLTKGASTQLAGHIVEKVAKKVAAKRHAEAAKLWFWLNKAQADPAVSGWTILAVSKLSSGYATGAKKILNVAKYVSPAADQATNWGYSMLDPWGSTLNTWQNYFNRVNSHRQNRINNMKMWENKWYDEGCDKLKPPEGCNK